MEIKLKTALAVLALSIVLAACGGGSGGQSSSVETVEPTGDEREIIIKGSNFDFDQDEYHVAVGEAVKLIYQDEEGSHGISVNRTNISLRNNEEVVVRFTEAGTFNIICSIYCGAGHTDMSAKLVVQ